MSVAQLSKLKAHRSRSPRSKDDDKELYDLLGSKQYRVELDRQFKNLKSNFEIAVVVDMWLTGFDASALDCIYTAKPLQCHSLPQIKSQTNLAIAHYNNADQQNIEAIAPSAAAVKDRLDLLRK